MIKKKKTPKKSAKKGTASKHKIYTKDHKKAEAAFAHAKKIKKRGGKVKETWLPKGKGVRLEYHF